MRGFAPALRKGLDVNGARDGIEPPTRGFSIRMKSCFCPLIAIHEKDGFQVKQSVNKVPLFVVLISIPRYTAKAVTYWLHGG